MVRYIVKGDEAPNLIKITTDVDIELSALEVKIGPITKLYEVPVTPEPLPPEGDGGVAPISLEEGEVPTDSFFPIYVSLTGEETSQLADHNLVVISKYNYDKKITFMGSPLVIHTCNTPVCPSSEVANVTLSDSQNLIKLNLFSTPQIESGKFVEVTPTVEGYVISTDGGATWGKIEGLLEDQLDLKEVLDEKQPLLTEMQVRNIEDVPNKAYTTYVDEELAKKQPLGDYALTSELSTAAVTLQRNIDEVDEVVQTSLGEVSYNSSNGVITFTKNDSSTTTINLPTELAITGVDYDGVTNELVLTRVDGSEIRVPLAALIDVYTGSDGSNIQITISGDNTISAILKTGTITRAQLNAALQSELNSLADDIAENARVIGDKQNTLVSGETIKTINGQTVLGSGNIIIEGGSGGTTVHNDLTGRDVAGAHPMSVITGLNEALSGKQPIGDYALSSQIPTTVGQLDNDVGFITTDALENYVEKEEGKSLIADTEIERLAGVYNYNDTGIRNLISQNTTKIEENTQRFSSLTKSDVGLANVDNTSDINKPISNATQLALTDLANQISQAVAGALKMRPDENGGVYQTLAEAPLTDNEPGYLIAVIQAPETGIYIWGRDKSAGEEQYRWTPFAIVQVSTQDNITVTFRGVNRTLKETFEYLDTLKADKFLIKTTLDANLTDKTEYKLDPQSANITITGATGEGIVYFIATADLTLTIPTGHLLAVGSTDIKANTNNQIIYNQNMWYIVSVGA